MHNVEIKVFRIGRTQADEDGMREWLEHLGADEYASELFQKDLTGAELVVGNAAKRCYLSFENSLNPNVTKVRKDWDDYFANILKSGHGSVLEHGTYSYAIEGVSRVFTGELNRHRAGVAISEGSMRYIRFDDVPWWIPSLLTSEGDEELKAETLSVFNEAFKQAEVFYKELCRIWGIDDPNSKMPFAKKKILTSMFRRIIPMGVATGGVWTFNLRALRHVIALRTTPHAEEEIAYVLSLIAKDIVEREPRIFCDFEKTENGWVPKYEKV